MPSEHASILVLGQEPKTTGIVLGPPYRLKNALQRSARERVAAMVVMDDR